jgi:hypothetical protein
MLTLNEKAKQKATELYIKCDKLFETPYETHHKTHCMVKEIMLLITDELLNEFPSECPKDSYEMERHLLWQEVKKEIPNL